MASIPNHMIIMGPNDFPIAEVPNCCIRNKPVTIAKAMGNICKLGNCNFKPSTAETIVIEGVIIPSANSALPPIIATANSHFFRFRTRAYKAIIPPSPLLSARKVIKTYLMVVCSVSVHIIHEIAPSIKSVSIVPCEPAKMAFIT